MPAATDLDRHERESQARSAALTERLLVTPPSKFLATSSTTGMLLLVAVPLLAHLTVLVWGAWLLLRGPFAMWGIVFGVPLILVGIVPFVRFDRPRFEAVSVSRDEAPTMYQLVDSVARSLGLDPTFRVELINEYNIRVFHSRGRVLQIGLPLWMTWDDDQRIGGVSGIMAHFQRERHWRWRMAMMAERLHDVWTGGFRFDHWHGDAAKVRPIWFLRLPIELWGRGIARSSESVAWVGAYQADQRAAELSSTKSQVESMAALQCGFARAESRFDRWWLRRTAGGYWAAMTSLREPVPPTERERWLRVTAMACEHSPFDHVPSPGQRTAVLLAHPAGSVATPLAIRVPDREFEPAALRMEELIRDGAGKRSLRRSAAA